MNFKNEEDLLVAELINLRASLYLASNDEIQEEIKRKIGIVTGTSLWLYSNESTINSLEDFRSRIDKFKDILNNDAYVKMSDNLYISMLINSFLCGNLSEEEFSRSSNILIDGDELDFASLSQSSTQSYNQAKSLFDSLSDNKDIVSAKEECHFPMSLKFSDDFMKADELYYSVSTFYGIADRLDEIYELKRTQKQEGRVRFRK